MMEENQKILVLEGSIRECFYLRNRPFGSCAGGKIRLARIQSSRMGKEPLHEIIPGWMIVSNNRRTLIVVVIVDHLRTWTFAVISWQRLTAEGSSPAHSLLVSAQTCNPCRAARFSNAMIASFFLITNFPESTAPPTAFCSSPITPGVTG